MTIKTQFPQAVGTVPQSLLVTVKWVRTKLTTINVSIKILGDSSSSSAKFSVVLVLMIILLIVGFALIGIISVKVIRNAATKKQRPPVVQQPILYDVYTQPAVVQLQPVNQTGVYVYYDGQVLPPGTYATVNPYPVQKNQ